MVKPTSSPPAAPQQPSTSSSLTTACTVSTHTWRADLKTLFELARERFPDVVWELGAGEDHQGRIEEVWGHKGQ
ncbi:hypothetical protein FRC02_003621 [Tulasnella sp. 418]|nr:hypothetical protein FRC02_003621 [Tulasnella sp. 418]